MRYFLFALGGAAVASLWWAVGVFGRGEDNARVVGAVVASVVLLLVLVISSAVEDKL